MTKKAKSQMQGLEDLRQGLDSAAQEALAEIRTRWRQMNQGPGAIESFKGFVAAVDWSVRLSGGARAQ